MIRINLLIIFTRRSLAVYFVKLIHSYYSLPKPVLEAQSLGYSMSAALNCHQVFWAIQKCSELFLFYFRIISYLDIHVSSCARSACGISMNYLPTRIKRQFLFYLYLYFYFVSCSVALTTGGANLQLWLLLLVVNGSQTKWNRLSIWEAVLCCAALPCPKLQSRKTPQQISHN